MILLILLASWTALFAWLAFSCWRAPIGYEDRLGFHYGSVPEHGEPPRRRNARGRARRTIEAGRHAAA